MHIFESLKRGKNEKQVLREFSKRLRRKAQNENLIIDDTFRNMNGMTWQIGFAECTLKK